ncbi:hypothetical protein EPI10_022511 [Gossypium australe]|uniref:Uncharacterized protein n=1 Tax=Gossypium australe TaxID=47621 RepID=A0A5B6VSS9_9ROSI|nr:hypothetical protein EPI10_022511 [Gossypium australe]
MHETTPFRACFSAQIQQETKKEEISCLLGVKSSTNFERHLGLPNVVNRRKKKSFEDLKERVGVLGYYPKGERRSLSNQYSRQYQAMLYLALFYQILYVGSSKTFLLDSNGKKDMGKVVYIGVSGSIYVVLKKKAKWGLEAWLNLISIF